MAKKIYETNVLTMFYVSQQVEYYQIAQATP